MPFQTVSFTYWNCISITKNYPLYFFYTSLFLPIFECLNKFVVILFLSVLFLDFGGVLVLFKFEQGRIRKEIKRQIKRGVRDEDLFSIEVNAQNEHEFVWIKNHEFRYQGRLYDVVKTEPCNQGKIYWCINDIQEQQLFSHLDEWVKKRSDKDNAGKSVASKLFKFLLYYFPSEVAAYQPTQTPTFCRNWRYHFQLKCNAEIPDGPPPRFLFFHC